MDIIDKFLKASWLDKARVLTKNPQKVLGLLDVFRKYIGKNGLKSIKADTTILCNYVKDIIEGRYTEYKKTDLILVVGAIIYVVTPMDILPDFIMMLGLVDDVAIVSWAVNQLGEELSRYRQWREKQE